MTTDDREYYLSRAIEEDEAALGASCTAARGCHEQLAVLYRARCGSAHSQFIRASNPAEDSQHAQPVDVLAA